MATTFDDIVTPLTQQEFFDEVLIPEMQRLGMSTTDWGTGDPLRILALASALVGKRGAEALATLAAASFEDYAFGLVAAPNELVIPDSWSTLWAKQRYNIDRIAATRTTRTLRFTNAVAVNYGPYAAGDLVVEFIDYDGPDNRYVLNESGTIAASTTTDLEFRSEYAHDSAAGYSYQHAAGTTIRLVTAGLPGVTITNPAGTYTSVSLSGTSEGTVTPSDTPAGAYTTASWEVNIVTTGQAAACTWRYRARNSSGTLSAWTNVVATASVNNALGGGTDITLANDATVNPSFIAGDTFRWATPGTDIVVAGRDLETRQALGIRCRGIWPSLSFVKDDDGNALPLSPSALAYETHVRSASDQVVHCLVQTDATVNGKVNITVAGQGSALAPATLTALQTFIDSVSDLTDYVVIGSPDMEPITLGGAVTVTVEAGMLATAQTEMQSAITSYFLGTDDTNRIGLNPRIDRAYLVRLIRGTRGVTATNADTALTINGGATDLQLPVTPGTVELARFTGSVVSLFTWSVA